MGPQAAGRNRSYCPWLNAPCNTITRPVSGVIEERWGARLALMNISDFGDYLTVKRGVGYERDYIAWLQWVMAILEERVKQQREERISE